MEYSNEAAAEIPLSLEEFWWNSRKEMKRLSKWNDTQC